MRIGWITYAPLERTAEGGITSNVASLRYRVLSPVQNFQPRGVEHVILPVLPEAPEANFDQALTCDLLIFSKSFVAENEALAARAKAAGRPVIFDVCDNHFEGHRFADHYRAMAGLADRVVCNSPEMAKSAARFTARPPLVIEDPYEGVRGAPSFAPGETLKLLWFGYPQNLDSLVASLEDLAAHARTRPISLRVLTQPHPLCDALVAAAQTSPLALAVESWSREAQWAAIAACDAVIIPSLQDERKRTKSANRLIETLWAGKPVVAQPLPAYAPFAVFTPVRETLSEGLRALEVEAGDVPARIAAAQAEIAATYDPARIGRKWGALAEAVLKEAAR